MRRLSWMVTTNRVVVRKGLFSYATRSTALDREQLRGIRIRFHVSSYAKKNTDCAMAATAAWHNILSLFPCERKFWISGYLSCISINLRTLKLAQKNYVVLAYFWNRQTKQARLALFSSCVYGLAEQPMESMKWADTRHSDILSGFIIMLLNERTLIFALKLTSKGQRSHSWFEKELL